jgi:hypothetical protein
VKPLTPLTNNVRCGEGFKNQSSVFFGYKELSAWDGKYGQGCVPLSMRERGEGLGVLVPVGENCGLFVDQVEILPDLLEGGQRAIKVFAAV